MHGVSMKLHDCVVNAMDKRSGRPRGPLQGIVRAHKGGRMSKVPRNLDGVFYRVQRNGRWCTVCFSDMTPDERKEIIYDRMGERPLDEQVG